MHKSLIISTILFFTILLAILIWGGLTNWKFVSHNSLLKTTLVQNECNPTKGCNVCAACCKPYISADYCDRCVSEQCSRCIPNSLGKCSTGVCSDCCYSYLNNNSNCEGCIKTQCIGCNNNGTFDPSTTTCSCYDDPVSCQNSKTLAICNQNPKCQWINESCSAKYKWKGPNCQYSRYTTCNGLGNPDQNGKCACDHTIVGEHCEYSRADCNNHGNPTWNGKTKGCDCDPGWSGPTCTGIAKVSAQGFTNPGASGSGTCTDIWVCPWEGVTLDAPLMTHGTFDGWENAGSWQNCIHVEDSATRGPDFTFVARGANGKIERYYVQKDCCGFAAFMCWRSNTQPVKVSGGTNYQAWEASETTPGGIIIGMPL